MPAAFHTSDSVTSSSLFFFVRFDSFASNGEALAFSPWPLRGETLLALQLYKIQPVANLGFHWLAVVLFNALRAKDCAPPISNKDRCLERYPIPTLFHMLEVKVCYPSVSIRK